MGTRSTTKIYDEDGRFLVGIYRQFDGYPNGMGEDLANFLKPFTVVNGFNSETMKAGTHANGMACLAAQLIAHFKTDLGNIYITHKTDSQQYNYEVSLKNGKIHLRAESEYYGLLFNDDVANWNVDEVNATEERLADAQEEEEI